MRDVVWTIIIVWVVWKIWSSLNTARKIVIQKNEEHHHHYHTNNTEGKTTVVNSEPRQKKHDGDQGEYVDFEEIK